MNSTSWYSGCTTIFIGSKVAVRAKLASSVHKKPSEEIGCDPSKSSDEHSPIENSIMECKTYGLSASLIGLQSKLVVKNGEFDGGSSMRFLRIAEPNKLVSILLV